MRYTKVILPRADGPAFQVTLDVARELIDGGVAARRFLAHRHEHNVGEIGVQMRSDLTGVRDFGLAHSAANARERVGRDGLRPFAGEELKKDSPQCVHIGGCRYRRSHHLLRAGIFGSERPGERRGREIRGNFIGEKLGDTEIEQLGRSIRGHQNVARLEIAMNDEIAMGVRYRLADSEKQSADRARGQWVLAAEVVERAGLPRTP